MELTEVFEKIDDIAAVFVDNLNANYYSSASVTETEFSFYVEEVEGLEMDRLFVKFPIYDLNGNSLKIWAAWKKEQVAKEKERKATVRRYEKLKKDPGVKEFIEILSHPSLQGVEF